MVNQRNDILPALPQRRNVEGNQVEPVIQIPAERPLLHHLFKVAVRSGDDTHIDGNGARIAHTLDDLAIQYPEELYLRRQRQLADFVEKEGSPVGTLEIAAPPGLRPGERPFFIAEKFALQQCGSDGAAIHPHKRPPAPARKLMDGLRNKLFAGAGFPVVKHGNYGATSVSGASNVMEQHGVKFTSDVDQLRRSMEKCNLAYLHAPLFNPALKAVAPVRKGLAVRTFFNMLGPLVNPVLPAYQLLGVYNLPLLRLYTYTYQESKTKFAVVHSLDGYDEISLTNEFKVATSDHEKIYAPESLGFSRYKETDLDGGQTPEDAAKIFDQIMNNTATEAQKNVVVVNSAFAIHVICPEKTIEECIALSKESLESGRALATLKKFIELNS